MHSRLQKPQKKQQKQRLSSNPPQVPRFHIQQDFALDFNSSDPPSSHSTTAPSLDATQTSQSLTPPTPTRGTFSKVSNSMSDRFSWKRQSTLSPSPPPRGSSKMVQTIRTVHSFEAASETSSDTHSRKSAFSSSVNSNASAISMTSNHRDRSPSVKLKSEWANANGVDATMKVDSPSSRRDQAPHGDEEHPVGAVDGQGTGWDSTIGKAGLGKTGRVINKLVSDNEALKRDIQIERLRAEEAKQAAKLVEDKMERLISDYESRLLEASVTKTLLSRKERQVETLHASVEMEKKRTADAQQRERSWREEMDIMRSSTTKQVDDANTHAALMEGRYNAISTHWKDQGDEVKRSHLKLRAEIAGLVEERRRDDEKITALRDLCDQQDGNIKELQRQKDEIGKKFAEYKAQQEETLKSIKTGAAEREAEQQRLIEETKSTLARLKWALSVNENVKDLVK